MQAKTNGTNGSQRQCRRKELMVINPLGISNIATQESSQSLKKEFYKMHHHAYLAEDENSETSKVLLCLELKLDREL